MAVSLFYITGIALGRLWLEAPPWAVLLSGLLLAAVLWALWKRGLALFAALLLLAAAPHKQAAPYAVSIYATKLLVFLYKPAIDT